jgi:hypothetical protein
MFLTAPASYLRAQVRAWTDWSRGDISAFELGKKMALYQVAIPMFFQFVSSGFNFDEDEAKRAAIVGNINGLFIIGDLASKYYDNEVMGKSYPVGQEPHFLSWMKDMYNGVATVLDGDADGEEMLKGLTEIAAAMGKVTGLPVDAVEGVIEGGAGLVDEINEYDPEMEDVIKNSLRALGWSKSSLK